MKQLITSRRQWQRQSHEYLIVVVSSTSYGPSATRAALELGRALVTLENRCSKKNILLFELDFWAPTLAGHLTTPSRETYDLLSAFQALASRQDLHEELRRTEGLVHSSPDLERWAQELRPLLPEPSEAEDHLKIYPAANDDAAFERAKRFSPPRLVTLPAKPLALPGLTLWRLLLTALAREHSPGLVLLSVSPGWNLFSLLCLGSLADVVIQLCHDEHADQGAVRPLAEFLVDRRQRLTTRPEFENDVMLVVGRRDRPDVEAGSAGGDPSRLWSGETRWLDAIGSGHEAEALESLARDLDKRAASKAAGGVELELVSDPEAADRALLAELSKHEKAARRLRILVEKGPYGEYPIKRLGEATRDLLAALGKGGEGFEVEPVPIGHDEFLDGLADSSSMRACFEEAGVELLTFPHYMLGKLVEADMLLPWHVLEDSLADTEIEGLEERKIELWFHQVDEMCRFNGVLYAVPYSLLQKLLLVKKGSDLLRSVHSWTALKTRLDQEHGEAANWPLLIETKLDHIGIWYDWREFVHAFGGADFQSPQEREDYRGSDYGECWINHPQTVEATSFYLDLLSRTQRRVKRPIDWDLLLPLFLEDPASELAIAWSDIVAYHWKRPSNEQRLELPAAELPVGLEDRVEVRPFPSGHQGQTSLEGWVMAAPSWVAPERRRLVARLMAWFLSAPVQRRYAEHGGNTGRRDVGHALSDVQRLVHRSILAPPRPPALKSTFREAPAMIQQIGEALGTWTEPLLKGGVLPDADVLADQLDQLAREVTQNLLRNRARYRRPDYWRKLDEPKRS